MAISAQDKIIYVANQLGLSTLKNMQATTGCVYDTFNGTGGSYIEYFKNVSQKSWPLTNLTDNEFEVNSAFLIESISFTNITEYAGSKFNNTGTAPADRFKFLTYEIVIGNKTVVKTQKLRSGSPMTPSAMGGEACGHWMEGVGILIPPQVEFQVNVQFWNAQGATLSNIAYGGGVGGQYPDALCALYGTQVLLDFNTTL